jgi:hypothetical protein
VLAYDLAKDGFQALDIGQIDNEYEWYIKKATTKISIRGKMVAEAKRTVSDCCNLEGYQEYMESVLEEIK